MSIFVQVFGVLLLLVSATRAHKASIPAVIAFGDSILDTGNNNYIKTITKANFPPYGIDFPGRKATGRFGNGKVLSDLLAEALGVKDLLPPYLDPNLSSKDLLTGVNFASAGSGLDNLTTAIQANLSTEDQLKLFKEYLAKLKRLIGEEKAHDIISKSLFLISLGNNDIGITFYLLHLRMEFTISDYTSKLVSWAATFVKELYDLGARKMAFLSTIPVGCVPLERTLAGGLLRQCDNDANRASEMYNSKLRSELWFLNHSLPDSTIFFVDIYHPLVDLIQNHEKSGFENESNGCCGTGLLEATSFLCNPLTPFSCPNPSKYVFWDSVHPSERAYRTILPEVLSNHTQQFFK